MNPEVKRGPISIFLATSGHSGVDRIMKNLVLGLTSMGKEVHILKIKAHGPYFQRIPQGAEVFELGASHVNSAIPGLVRYLKRFRPPSLLTDKDRVNRAAILARIISGVPTKNIVRIGTTVSHNLMKRSFHQRYSQLLSIRLLYPLSHKVLVPSEGARKDLVLVAPGLSSKVKVVSSPVIDDEFQERAGQKVQHPWLEAKSEPVILGVGELSERKDFSTLVRAFSLVRKRISSKLIILGEGRKRGELLRLVSELGLEGLVDMPGFVENPLPFMAASDCFCLTSRCEGLPVALIEAMALGTPVVATDCPSGPGEVLKDGRLGRLVKVGDSEALGKAILKTLEGPVPKSALKEAVKRFLVPSATLEYLEELAL